MRVCVLSLEEVGRINHYGENPACLLHKHISLPVALEGIADDTYVTVDIDNSKLPEPLYCVTEQWSNDRKWRGRASEGFQVMQLVRVGA